VGDKDMNTPSERLQKAVELAIAAGYQLDKEAFEFLSIIAVTENPVEIVSKALRKLDTLKDKPLFIGKRVLEEFVRKPEPAAEAPLSVHVEHSQILEGKRAFQPFAKGVETLINVIDDPSCKFSSSGTIEDYLEHFRDRFKRLEKLLKQRMDVKGASSVVDALKAPPNTKLKIIGMITEKKETKQRILLTVEDLQASATVLVPQNSPNELLEKARMLLLDQVVCLHVTKVRDFLIAEDIILPDITPKMQNRAPLPVCAVLTSDLHVGSMMFHKEAFNRFVLWLNGKYGNEEMREIAGYVKYVLIAGDIVDGIGVYPNQVKELSIRDIYGQYKLAAKFLEQIPDYIEVIIIPGNHDAPRKALPQPPISREFLEPLLETRKVYSFGNPCMLSLHNVEVLLYHGRSLDDVVSTVPGMNYTQPEKAMTLLLQCRHLAPVYGGKNPISPEPKDHLVIERVPDIFHAGHIHTFGYTVYRNVLVVNSGCWQGQTEYMRRLGLTPMANLVPVVNLQTFEVKVLSFA
jgi:DNA polymerase II small subunit